jgi:hypothetical protein
VKIPAIALASLAGAAAALVVPVAVPQGAPLSLPDAAAVAPGQVVGVYRVRLTGEAWQSLEGVAGAQRLRADGFLTVERAGGAGSDLLRATITVGSGAASLLPGGDAFQATGTLAGDALGLIASGSPAGVSAANLRFEQNGRRVAGTWLLVIPAGTAESAIAGNAGGFTLAVKGRQTRRLVQTR